MHARQLRRPRGRSLTVIFLSAVGLLALESQLHLSPLGDKAALVAIVLVTYGLTAAWVTGNAAALDEDVTVADGPHGVRSEPTAANVPEQRGDELAGGAAGADR